MTIDHEHGGEPGEPERLRARVSELENKIEEYEDLDRRPHAYFDFIKRLADNAPVLMYVYDIVENRNVYSNGLARKLLGYTPEDIREMGDNFLASVLHPEDAAKLASFQKPFYEVADGETVYHEYRVRHADGNYRWLSDSASVLKRDPDGKPRLVLGVNYDITERKRLEERLAKSERLHRLLVAQIPDVVALLDDEGKIESINRYPEPFKASDVEGRSLFDYIREDRRSFGEERMREAIEKGVSQRYELPMITPDGTELWFDVRLAPYRDNGERRKAVVVATDISELRRSTEELRLANERMEAAQRLANFGVWDYDIKRKTLDWSDSMYALFGKDPESFTPTLERVGDLLHPDDREAITSAMARSIESGEAFRVTYRVPLPGGSLKYHEALGAAERDATDTPVRFRGAALDATEHKEVELALRREEKNVRELIENVPVSVQVIRKDGKTAFVNKAYEAMWAATDARMRERDFFQNGRAEKFGVTAAVRRSFEGETIEVPEFSYEVETSDGETRRVCARATTVPLMDEAGKVKRVIVMYEDVTSRREYERQLRESERRFRTLADNLPDIVCRFDLNLKHTYISPSVEKFTGVPAREYIGKGPSDFGYDPEFVEFLESRMRRAIETRAPVEAEYRFETKRGARRFHAAYAPEFDDNGEVVSLVHVSKDITERAKMENELREANAAKDKLFSVIAHDVRDPLHTIINVLTIVNHSPAALSERKREEYLREAERVTRGLNEMVENLLYWSRAQTERIVPEIQRLDATEFFRAEIERHRQKAERNGLRLNLSASDPVYVKADPQLLRIVARNVIGNAMKFTPSGGAVSVAIKPRGEFAFVEVADTGVGVPKDLVDSLFRIDGHAKRDGVRGERSGGMGLVLSREFVELMGGTIDVESEPGKGSKFFFTLRAAE